MGSSYQPENYEQIFISFVPAGEANHINYNKNIFILKMVFVSFPKYHDGFFLDLQRLGFFLFPLPPLPPKSPVSKDALLRHPFYVAGHTVKSQPSGRSMWTSSPLT